jgi:hypothetical protein
MSTPAIKAKILTALRGGRPESEPIEIAPGVTVTLRIVPVAAKETLRQEASAEVVVVEVSDDRDDRIYGALVVRILAAALAHHDLTLADVRENITAPVLRTLWSEYERLEALVSPSSSEELDTLHDNIKALVGDSRSAAATHLSGLGYTTLLRYAISTVGRPSN